MKREIFNPVLRETVVFTKTAIETAGTLSELEISLQPGGGNPFHYHTTFTETFTALEGELGLELKNNQKVILKPGESYLVKIGEVHRFFNPGGQKITFRNVISPGHTGFENTLRIMFGLAQDELYNDKAVPKNFIHLAVCGVMSDMRLPGLMSLTTPIVKLVAWYAKKKGIEQQLIDQYCV